jgi:hypothetical protein
MKGKQDMKMTFKNLFKVLGLDRVDWKKATTRLLAVLWGVLIFSWICKLFLGKQFNIMTNNESYINICNFLSQKPYVLMIPFPFYILSMYLVVWINGRRFPIKKDLLILIPISIIYIIKIFSPILAMILEIIFYILVSNKPFRIGIAIETYLLMAIFQQLSLNLRGIGIFIKDDDVFTNMIFFIDYYIMMSIYCIYTIVRKEGIIMGLWGPIFLSKKARQLTAYREKLVSKRVKLDSRIREIDRAIENEKVK